MKVVKMLVALAAVWLLSAGAAQASVFEVRSCGTSGTSAFTPSNTNSQTMATTVKCPAAPGETVSGISAVPLASTFTTNGGSSGWTISAPPGLLLRRLDVRRSIGTRRASWRAMVRTSENTVLDSCVLQAQIECRHGDPSGDTTAAYPDLNTRAVTFSIECVTDSPGLTCAGRTTPQAWVAIYSATALVDDPAPPAVTPLTGPLVAPGWHSGVERVDLAASDASGIKSLSLVAGDTRFFDSQPTCDFSRMQPCPASEQESVSVDTSRLEDGTYDLKAVATDAADQAGTATATLKVDRHAPEKPTDLLVDRNADGTLAFGWTNPGQGTAAPITGARYSVCDALGVNCVPGGLVAGQGIARLGALSIPPGAHVLKVWLQDEAGNADEANAATMTVDPGTITSRRPVDTNPPVLDQGPAPSASLRISTARRKGSTLTLSGTIARGATARLTARVSKGRTTKTLATATTKPKTGKWSLKVRLTSTLRRSSTFYVRVAFAGQSTYAKTTALRKLAKKAAKGGSTVEEFSLESRSAR